MTHGERKKPAAVNSFFFFFFLLNLVRTLKLQRNASIYTKRRQMRKAATRTAQFRVNCFGTRTDRTGKHNLGGRRAGSGAGGARGREQVRENGTNGNERGERGREKRDGGLGWGGARERRGELEGQM